MLGESGRLILVGLFGGELKVPTVVVTIKMLSVLGSHLGDLQDLSEMLALARGGTAAEHPDSAGYPGSRISRRFALQARLG